MALDKKKIEQALAILKSGGLVVFPTETLYGLAVDAFNRDALARLAGLKNRASAGKPIALILPSADLVEQVADQAAPWARQLMARYWPGPLTLIMRARPDLHPALVSPDGGVGLRVSPHPAALALAQGLAGPITATSANLAGQPPAARVEELAPELLAQADFLLDGGPCPGGPPSTVLDVRTYPPILIRPGAVKL